MSKRLGTIAVDLTPVLPGGENGGAKIFVLELLRHLAEMAPETQFVLLTQLGSHSELALLDRSNMRRRMVLATNTTGPIDGRWRSLALRISRFLPAKFRSAIKRWRNRAISSKRSRGSGALLHDMNVDLLFCPFTAPTYFEPGIPTVCTVYDLQYNAYPEFFEAADVAHREYTFKEACRLATSLAAISDHSRQSAIENGNLDPSRIRTIFLRMGGRIARGLDDELGALARLQLVKQKYLIYPANFWKHKNHEMLLTAFGIACAGGLPADIKLVCTGAPGARQQALICAARAMNLGERVLFPGFLPNAELAVLMSNCIGVVFPSLYEGFGLPVIEAMSSGVPVACSNTTSLPEVAAGAAVLFDPRVPTQIAQALMSLTGDQSLRARLVQRGLQRAEEFADGKRMAREYLQLFEDALVSESLESVLIGAYPDGWAGHTLRIQVTAAADTQTVELELAAPGWLPYPRLTVRASLAGESEGVPIVFDRGTNANISLPVGAAGGCCEVSIEPTFVPAHCGHGDDHRELSVMLQHCRVTRGGNESVELFHPKSLV